MLTTAVLDVGETLVDETAHWTAWADHLGVPTFTSFAALGGVLARGQDHREVVRLVRPHTDFASERPPECVHVGDRADNDLVGAAAAGMTVVHLRRGPWALLHPASGHSIDGLLELPPLLRRLRAAS